MCHLRHGFLPTEVTHVHWDDVGDARVFKVDFCAAQHGFQVDFDVHFTDEIGVVEGVGVVQKFIGVSSRYSPPNELLLPEAKWVNDILNVPPTRASRWCTVQVKP